MFRDFSQEAKEKLISYVNDTSSDGIWQIIKNSIDYMDVKIKNWLHTLDSYAYLSQMDGYYQTVLNKHDTTIEQIEQIFTAVEHVDTAYLKHGAEMNTCAEKIIKLMNTLAQTIDPAGGNLDMASQKGVLDAAVADLKDAQATVEKEIQEELLGTNPKANKMGGDPVNMSTGNFVYEHEDMYIGGEIPLVFHRYYNSRDLSDTSMGVCYRHNYEILLENENGKVTISKADGQRVHFIRTAEGIYQGQNTALDMLKETEDGYVLRQPDNIWVLFDKSGHVERMENCNRRGISFFYNEKKQLTEVVSDNGNRLRYQYNDNGRLVLVTDHTGRKVALVYEERKLVKVTVPSGSVYSYQYSENGRIKELVNAREVHAVCNEYDKKFRVVRQKFADGGEMEFTYLDADKKVIFTERNGRKITYVHDDKGRNVETIYEDGTREKFLYNDKNLCISKTDRLGRTTRMAYDRRGNLTQTVDAAKRRINMTYDADNHLLNVSVNGKERLRNYYDVKGNLICSENCDAAGVKIQNDEFGRPVNIVQVDGSQIVLAYDEKGNIERYQDAVRGETKYQYDELNRIIASVDANGNKTSYEYDPDGHIIQVKNAEGNTRSYVYNAGGKVISVTDFDGNKISVDYNEIGRMVRFTDKEGNVTNYEYDSMWNISAMTAPDGGITKSVFDMENRLVQTTFPEGGTEKYIYDVVGNRTGIIDAEGNITTFVYDKTDHIIQMTEADGAKTCFGYDRDGNIISVTNALGGITTYTYDEVGRRTSVTDVSGNTTSMFYNALGKIERVCYPNGSSKVFEYEIGGRLKKIIYPDGETETYGYDKKGNLVFRENGLGNRLTFYYDKMDRITQIINPVGGVRKYSYDAVGNIICIRDENENETHYTYSPNGNLTKVIDALGNTTKYVYDCMGRLIQTVCAGMKGETAHLTSYAWDREGRIVSVTDPLGDIEKYTYDKIGRIHSKVDKDGYTTEIGYNQTGQLKEVFYGDGRKVNLSYNALRQLEEVKDWLGTTTFLLDMAGRPLSVTDSTGGTIGYEWGAMGERKSVIYPDGKHVDYKYNKALQLTELIAGDDIVHYEYDMFGQLVEKKMPGDIKTNYRYNELGRLDEISYHGAELEEIYTYKYDVSGNKISQKKKRSSIEEDNGRLGYHYDALNRLKCVVQGENIRRECEYDAFGNRIKKIEYIEGLEKQTAYTYNERNQLLTESTDGKVLRYSYDRRGNLTKIQSGDEVLKQFTFDAANQMTNTIETQGSVRKNAVFEYNGLGYRISQKINCLTENNAETPQKRIEYITDMTRQYHNLLQMTTWDYQNAEPVYQKFIWDRNVVGLEKGRSKNFYLLDDLGSPMELLEEDGRVAESYAYDEFGASIYRTKDIFKNSLQPFGFTGYQMDETDGLYFAQTRRYDAGTGRFVSEDFMKGILEAPFTLNNYTYCWNNPLGLVDLNGMWPEFMETAGKWIGEHKEDIVAVTIGAISIAVAGVASICIPGVGTVVGGAILGAGLDAAIQYGDNGKVDVKQVMISGVVGAISSVIPVAGAKVGAKVLIATSSRVLSVSAKIGTEIIVNSALAASSSFVSDKWTKPEMSNEEIMEDVERSAWLGGIIGGITSGVNNWIGPMISKKLYCNQVGYEYANMGKLSNNIGLNSDHNINGTYLSNGIREMILKESRSELGKQICTQIIFDGIVETNSAWWTYVFTNTLGEYKKRCSL